MLSSRIEKYKPVSKVDRCLTSFDKNHSGPKFDNKAEKMTKIVYTHRRENLTPIKQFESRESISATNLNEDKSNTTIYN